MTGSEQETETLLPELETAPVRHASFAPPSGERTGGREAALLLRDALRLSLRRGAGPFRGAGRINFEPRAYQLAPLMMALRLETVRLLIADDVGIGKTIEAGLILREYLDRGEIDRFTVLCPPHLVDQWVAELETKFAIPPTPVTAATATRLERDLPASTSVFDAYPHTVVSLDFIKSRRRQDDFLRACPEMVVVDEAHTAVAGGAIRHHRFELLRRIAENTERNLILLTATPHSGNEEAFHNLLGLLDPVFAALPHARDDRHRQLRERLAGHFIQRRRADIEAWREPGLFPTRHMLNPDPKYRLTGDYERFYEAVLDYCAEAVEAEEGERRQRLAFWGTLALMRCVGSSPAAAARALRTRALLEADPDEEEMLAAGIVDDEEAANDDLEPGAAIADGRLAALIAKADELAARPVKDPKFAVLKKVLQGMVEDGFSPVVFCRYIATADSVGAALRHAFKDHMVEVVTGALPPEEREARVEALGEAGKRILVATDCLSEGINLQAAFDAVVHYDLSWNPTRHQQREGRVDRFGQKRPEVRTALIYGENNPVDGAVLEVILRKASAIEKQTGVRVPMPDEGGSLTKALMSAVLLRARQKRQLALDLGVGGLAEAKEIESAWANASEQEKKARTIFAQSSLKPEEVAAEWDAIQRVLGGFPDTERFVSRALMRLGAPLDRQPAGGYRAPLHLVPDTLKERFQAAGLIDETATQHPLRIAFEARPRAGYLSIHRAHPLPAILAETFLENALDPLAPANDPATLPRCGGWESAAVDRVTALLLLRIRHRIDSRGRLGPRFAMAEEAAAIAFDLLSGKPARQGEEAFGLLAGQSADLKENVQKARLQQVLAKLEGWRTELDRYAGERAAALAEDHTRLRRALGSKGGVKVEAVTPVDVIGAYVLMPRL
ncbi:ATP-dependent helicase HepA [Hypericibacter terrae]|uniref:ATP-dependent helicase HepA n=1 Tax=Hypericibacter terrae TaxID=2602015 RepID=A0A5J6ML66_9PROT|nr:ATP-dependent helicase HepA [Hypericibacter terrae]